MTGGIDNATFCHGALVPGAKCPLLVGDKVQVDSDASRVSGLQRSQLDGSSGGDIVIGPFGGYFEDMAPYLGCLAVTALTRVPGAAKGIYSAVVRDRRSHFGVVLARERVDTIR